MFSSGGAREGRPAGRPAEVDTRQRCLSGFLGPAALQGPHYLGQGPLPCRPAHLRQQHLTSRSCRPGAAGHAGRGGDTLPRIHLPCCCHRLLSPWGKGTQGGLPGRGACGPQSYIFFLSLFTPFDHVFLKQLVFLKSFEVFKPVICLRKTNLFLAFMFHWLRSSCGYLHLGHHLRTLPGGRVRISSPWVWGSHLFPPVLCRGSDPG